MFKEILPGSFVKDHTSYSVENYDLLYIKLMNMTD